MQSPGHPALQKLRDLDSSLSGFPDQLSNVLYGEEYAQCADFQDGDFRWLVDFLDQVRYYIILPRLRLNRPRLSMSSLISVLLRGNVYVNSEAYVELELYSPHPSLFRLTSILSPSHLMREALVMCTKGPSVVHRFASSACECMLSTIQKRLRKSVFYAIDLFPLTNQHRRPSVGKQ